MADRYCSTCKSRKPQECFSVKKNGEYQKTCRPCLGTRANSEPVPVSVVVSDRPMDIGGARRQLLDVISMVDDPAILQSCFAFIVQRLTTGPP